MAAYFSTLPPADWHSLSFDDITKPLPLQAFWPLQLLCALLHALWPLQEFPPTHFTWADDASELGLSAAIALPTNINATAVARAAPVILVPLRIIVLLPIFALRALVESFPLGMMTPPRHAAGAPSN
jgi:hypothetical protein